MGRLRGEAQWLPSWWVSLKDQGGNKPTQASTLAISMSPIRGEEAQTHGGEEERPQLDKGKETDLKIYYYDEMLMEEQE